MDVARKQDGELANANSYIEPHHLLFWNVKKQLSTDEKQTILHTRINSICYRFVNNISVLRTRLSQLHYFLMWVNIIKEFCRVIIDAEIHVQRPSLEGFLINFH